MVVFSRFPNPCLEKFKVQGSKFKVRRMPIRTFHNLQVGQKAHERLV
jgi:hypothetical protein